MKPRSDEGLLLLRVGIGLMFVGHGIPKLLGGPELWEALGHAMGGLGLDFAPTFWGLAAAVSEAVGGLLLALGFLFRPATALLFATMIVASIRHWQNDDGFAKASHAMEAAVVFASLYLIGPGAYRFGKR